MQGQGLALQNKLLGLGYGGRHIERYPKISVLLLPIKMSGLLDFCKGCWATPVQRNLW